MKKTTFWIMAVLITNTIMWSCIKIERDETKSTNNDNDTTYRLQQVDEVETDELIPITFGGIIVNDWDEIRVDIE